MPFMISTDYITGLYRPFLAIIFLVMNSIVRKKSGETKFLQLLFNVIFIGVIIEIVYWRFMLEKAMLFLKTEVDSRSEKRMRKILFDLPESVLISDKRAN